MTDLRERFERLGLSQYLEAFIAEGFDSWQTVADVSEADLITLNVKLGHRRKLQRAISDWRKETGTIPLVNIQRRASVDGSYRTDESDNDLKSSRSRDIPVTAAPQSTKRKYRRHPKPDEHAPERPPSAYVIFSNQVRETLRGQEHSFSEIAKIVGERWQVLSPSSRESCDKQAATAKEKYYQELSEYKKTPQYAQYQVYLAEFKAKYNSNPGGREEGKRSKLEPEASSVSAPPLRTERMELPQGRRSDVSIPHGHQRDSSTDYYDPIARQHRYQNISDVSSVARSFANVTSPHMHDHYSPASTSPAAANTAHHDRHLLYPMHEHDLRARHPTTNLGSPAYIPPTTSPPPAFNAYDPKLDVRHPRRDPPELQRADSSVPSVPSLAHTDTSMSSISTAPSRHGSSNSVPPLRAFSSVDGPKAHRILPQPIPTTGIAPSIPDPLAPANLPTRLASPAPLPADRRTGLDALLIATEMVGNTNRAPAPPEDRPP